MMERVLSTITNFAKGRVFKFLVVGFFNAAFHSGFYYFLMSNTQWASTINNLIAFCFSVQVSYLGHRFITFSNPDKLKTKSSFAKFVIQALTNISISSLFGLFLIDYLNYPYYYLILFNVIVLPFVSFTMMKMWVFKVKEIDERN